MAAKVPVIVRNFVPLEGRGDSQQRRLVQLLAIAVRRVARGSLKGCEEVEVA